MNTFTSHCLRGCLLTVCAQILFLGCGSTINTVENSQPIGQRQMVDDKRILTDRSLSVRGQVVGVNKASTQGGNMKVQVELLNTTRSAARLYYQFEWFDQDGMQVQTPANNSLQIITLEGKESKFVSAVAPSMNCNDFRLKLMRAQ